VNKVKILLKGYLCIMLLMVAIRYGLPRENGPGKELIYLSNEEMVYGMLMLALAFSLVIWVYDRQVKKIKEKTVKRVLENIKIWKDGSDYYTTASETIEALRGEYRFAEDHESRIHAAESALREVKNYIAYAEGEWHAEEMPPFPLSSKLLDWKRSIPTCDEFDKKLRHAAELLEDVREVQESYVSAGRVIRGSFDLIKNIEDDYMRDLVGLEIKRLSEYYENLCARYKYATTLDTREEVVGEIQFLESRLTAIEELVRCLMTNPEWTMEEFAWDGKNDTEREMFLRICQRLYLNTRIIH